MWQFLGDDQPHTDADGSSVTNIPHVKTISYVLGALAIGAYHWQCRGRDAGLDASTWVPFGGNDEFEADFRVTLVGEEPLAMLANQLSSYRPDDAIALASLNLEFYPKSVNTLVSMSAALTRKHEDDDAIAMLEKAVSFEPENGVIRGRLEQLKSYRRKR